MGLRGETFEKDGTMKVLLGFNDIRPDGMGSAAMTLMRALHARGIEVVPIHAWHHIEVVGYEKEFKPVFVREQDEEPPLCEVISEMVRVVNEFPGGTHFSYFGAPNWGAVVPYLRQEIRIVESVHNTNPSTIKLALAHHQRITAYVGVSKGVVGRVKKALPASERGKVFLVPNAIGLPKEKDQKQSYDVGTVFRLVYLGRIENQGKGCGKLPYVLKVLKGAGCAVSLDLYGYYHGYQDAFEKLCLSCGVSDLVHYRGVLPPERVYSTLAAYDALIMPSNFEGYGLSLVEAMAVGLPCIVSDLKDVTAWIVAHGKSGLLVGKNDIPGFASAVKKLWESGECYRRRLGEGARLRAFELASLESHATAYANVLEWTLNAPTDCLVPPECPLEEFRELPRALRSWWLARLLPPRVKAMLRRFMR